jgi:hypothetical protein
VRETFYFEIKLLRLTWCADMLEWQGDELSFKLKVDLLAWQERTSASTLHTWGATKVSSKSGAFGSNQVADPRPTNMC